MKRSMHTTRVAITVALACAAAFSTAIAEDETAPTGDKHVSGMSIVGNDESPKSLVIVPWKSSDLGGDLDFTRRFGDDRSALDPQVFRRRLDYHEIRTGRNEP